MLNTIEVLSDSIRFLEKSSSHFVEGAQSALHDLNQIKRNNSGLVINNYSAFNSIENSLKFIIDITDWIDDIQLQLENLKRKLVNEISC